MSEAKSTGEEIVAFLVGAGMGKGASLSRGSRFVANVRNNRERQNPEAESERKEKIRVRRLVQALKKDGLLMSERQGKEARYALTAKGRAWLSEKGSTDLIFLKGKKYASEPSERVTIIAYDIPHWARNKRDWLRARIMGMGFHFLQRSVFLGKIKIPRDFMDDLEDLGISEYVEIFEITKEGTLRVPGKDMRAKV